MPQNLHGVECTAAGHPAHDNQVELTWLLLLAAAVNVHTLQEVAVKLVFDSDIPSLLCSGPHDFLLG
jgi:hypothetical protein